MKKRRRKKKAVRGEFDFTEAQLLGMEQAQRDPNRFTLWEPWDEYDTPIDNIVDFEGEEIP